MGVGAMRTSKRTHFEQIPVEIVRQIATEDPPEEVVGEASPSGPMSDAPGSSNGTQDNAWRRVAEEIVQEKDAEKIMLLAERLNRALELRQGASRKSTAKG